MISSSEHRVVALRHFWVVGLWITVMIGGCSNGDDDETSPPLQPLIYTEYPGLTPEGAAVRERRLMRQLLDGVVDGNWGTMEDKERPELVALDSPTRLGEAIAEALFEKDEHLWESAFVADHEYARLVGIAEDDAREFVDNQMGRSLSTWNLFARIRDSEVPEGGLSSQLEFRKLELGSGHDIHGRQTDEDEEVVQYWHNRIVLVHPSSEATFELSISRIFRLAPGASGTDTTAKKTVYHVASPIEADERLQAFLSAGLHLRPRLLRPEEFPFPLGIGTFWRYRRYDVGVGADESTDPLDRRFDERPEGINAEELIVEVTDVAIYGPVRLVELRHSYDDPEQTRIPQWWVLTPRRIYICDDSCRDNIDNLDWLLTYFAKEVPILRFPLSLGTRWATSGQLVDQGGVFSVDDEWHQLSTPAGSFSATYRIGGAGPLDEINPYLRGVSMVRDFAPGRGIVRRQLFGSADSLEAADIIEELVEYRIMN